MLLITSFTISFICVGVYVITNIEGLLFYKLSEWGLKANKWYLKPLFMCLPCMASFWGLLYFLLNTKHHTLAEVLFSIIMACGINQLINQTFFYD